MGQVWRTLSVGFGLLLASAGISLADPVAQIVRIAGTVELTHDTQVGAAALGTALEMGDVLRTDSQGRVRVQFIDGSTINLGSESELLITAVASGGPGTERQIELDMGTGALRAFAAPATPKSRFEIRTPLAVTAVRGTEWGIFSSAALSQILVVDGRVGIRRNIVSGESGMSITGGRSIGVTADALGQPGRLTDEQMAALEAATSVPGTDIPFNPSTAPAPTLTPPDAPLQQEEQEPQIEPDQPVEETQEQSQQAPEEQQSQQPSCRNGARNCKKSDGGRDGGRSY